MEDFHRFNESCMVKTGRSVSYQNIIISALKLYFQVVHKRQLILDEWNVQRREQRLPQIFSKEEVSRHNYGAPLI